MKRTLVGGTRASRSVNGRERSSVYFRYCCASHIRLAPLLTTPAHAQAAGAASQSARREPSRDGRTTEAPSISSWQTGADAARPDPARLRRDRTALAALAHESGPAPRGFRRERFAWPGPCPARSSVRRHARILEAAGSHLEVAARECETGPGDTPQKRCDPPARRCG